jgi:hypothetical protein
MALLNQTTEARKIMNMDKFTKQALEAAEQITGKPMTDTETQEIAFKLACAMMAEEAAR